VDCLFGVKSFCWGESFLEGVFMGVDGGLPRQSAPRGNLTGLLCGMLGGS